MELWVVRHGETIGNIKRIIQGQSGGELTTKGFVQAKLVAKRLSNVQFNEAYISDLNRTIQTANEILSLQKKSSEIEVKYEKRIREKHGGVLEGMPLSTSKKIAEKKGIQLRKFRPVDGECWLDVMRRAGEFLIDLINKNVQKIFALKVKSSIEKEVNQEVNKTELQPGVEDINNTKIVSNFVHTEERKEEQSVTVEAVAEPSAIPIEEDEEGEGIKTSSTEEKHTTEKIKIDVSNSVTTNSTVEVIKESSPDITIDEETLKMIDALQLDKKYSKPYLGYEENSPFKRILIVTHGGFIMEFMNVIRVFQKKPLRLVNDSENTSVYVIRIYCTKCGGICKIEDKDQCKLEFDFVIYNDSSHLSELK